MSCFQKYSLNNRWFSMWGYLIHLILLQPGCAPFPGPGSLSTVANEAPQARQFSHQWVFNPALANLAGTSHTSEEIYMPLNTGFPGGTMEGQPLIVPLYYYCFGNQAHIINSGASENYLLPLESFRPVTFFYPYSPHPQQVIGNIRHHEQQPGGSLRNIVGLVSYVIKLNSRKVKEELKKIPNPIWPSTTAEAVSGDFCTLRPFNLFKMKSRSSLRATALSAYQLQRLRAVFNSQTERISNRKHVLNSLLECQKLSIVYRTYEIRGSDKELFGYISLVDRTGGFHNRRYILTHIEQLVQEAAFLHSMTLKLRQMRETQEKKDFFSWLLNEAFNPSFQNSLPIIGKVHTLQKLDSSAFGEAQTILLLALSHPNIIEVADGAALSLVALWYKEKKPEIWEKEFQNSRKSFFLKFIEILRTKITDALYIEYWCCKECKAMDLIEQAREKRMRLE
ncbi:hypothetical protein O181_023680 [Austropuccinia psidii MF-1]|uniref:Uncharacterized protein n=1 Tax=Austropuccinia psidii MF-1 TaxID=1389203 RepID=A0A9Q3CJ02_9BASI|nr:hypothetical protein [Austropuccinia psidii MF-1]